ncbi:MAG: cytochrome P450 [Candidatus Sphingomonas colombiensis]|nr:cytochrome P450 [Sphingomonas sp.]WEK42372.1 MAG: cytochrome P450 [Sphingomonas sp.]
MPSEEKADTRAPVVAFDFYAEPALLDDVHARYWALKETAPPVFWTPANGGHWVVTTAAGVIEVCRHPEIFSSRYLSIPKNDFQPHMIPESLDPPEHRAYRQLLRPYFEKAAIAPLEARIADWTESLIEGVRENDGCEFVASIGSHLPISVFMELFGFPLEEFDEFRDLVVAFFDFQGSAEARMGLALQIYGKINALIDARRTEPREDLMSRLLTTEFEGRTLTDDELRSIGFLMFLAGLDTVVNAMSFGMRHLAGDAALRQRMIDDPACIPDAVEELLRRYAFVSIPRYVAQDTELLGVQLKAGDMILAPLAMVGWDTAMNGCPADVDVDRKPCRHAAFGSGIHTCLGLHLARLELTVFYRQWFARIGHFRLAENAPPPRTRGGSVYALNALHLAWDHRK